MFTPLRGRCALVAAAVLTAVAAFATGAAGAGHAQTPATAAVTVTSDLDYVPTAEYAAKKDRLDVYAPAGVKAAPVVVSIHGGALREGDKSGQAYVGQLLAKAGFVAVIINYRLSPGVS